MEKAQRGIENSGFDGKPLDGATWEFSERGASRGGLLNDLDPERKGELTGHRDFSALREPLRKLTSGLQELFVDGWRPEAVLGKESDPNFFAIVFTNKSRKANHSIFMENGELRKKGLFDPLFFKAIRRRRPDDYYGDEYFEELVEDHENRAIQEEDIKRNFIQGDGVCRWKLSQDKSNELLKDAGTGLFTSRGFSVRYNQIVQQRGLSRLFDKNFKEPVTYAYQSGVIIVMGEGTPIDEALSAQTKRAKRDERCADEQFINELKGNEEKAERIRGKIEAQRVPVPAGLFVRPSPPLISHSDA